MIAIPLIATVADLQRKYRSLVERIRETGEPMIVVNNGKPDVVVMDVSTYEAQTKRLREFEEAYVLKAAREGLTEYKKGKTIKLEKGQTLLDIL